jgi:hypothetical protein
MSTRNEKLNVFSIIMRIINKDLNNDRITTSAMIKKIQKEVNKLIISDF